jgi:hypothetical protein
MQPAYGWLVKLDVAVRKAVLPADGDFGKGGPGLPNEPDFLPDVTAFEDFQAPREELQRAVNRAVNAEAGWPRVSGLDRSVSICGGLEPQPR